MCWRYRWDFNETVADHIYRYRSKRAASSSENVVVVVACFPDDSGSELRKKNEERVKRLSREGMIDIPKDKAKVVADAGIKISPAPSYTET